MTTVAIVSSTVYGMLSALIRHHTKRGHTMQVVNVVSPFRSSSIAEGNENYTYATRCLYDSLVTRRECPFATHLLYTQSIDNNNTTERRIATTAAHSLYSDHVIDKVAIYCDRGISEGMRDEITVARRHFIPVEVRTLDNRTIPERMLYLGSTTTV